VADAALPSLRGTAFGLFHVFSGTALFFASVLAGWLWSALGPAATFGAGALFAMLALLSLMVLVAPTTTTPRRSTS
jgi:MFS family permease